MIALLWLVLVALGLRFKSKGQLEAENMALRYQVMVLRRQARGKIRLTDLDRLFLVQLYRWFPSIVRGPRHRSAGDGHSLASGGFSPLLTLEVPFPRRAAADRW